MELEWFPPSGLHLIQHQKWMRVAAGLVCDRLRVLQVRQPEVRWEAGGNFSREIIT